MRKRTVFASGILALLLAIAPATPHTAPAIPSFARVHHVVGTPSTLAQAAFDRGLTLLYAFSRRAARRSFYDAARADPHLAMAYWGIAMSYGSNINFSEDAPSERSAYRAIRRALTLSGGAPVAQRDYIRALAVRFSNAAKPDDAALARSYHAAMRALVAKYPADLDAATLYAESGMDLRPWDLYANDGTPRLGTQEICATLETVLAREPGHIGANHFYIHATEASLHPERALPSAGRIAKLHFESAAAHLTHMPAHTFARVGYYAAAAASSVAATRDDRTYLLAEGRGDGEGPLYYGHDLWFLAYAYEMDGDLAGARAARIRLNDAGALDPATFVLLRYQLWNEILALPQPKPDSAEPMRPIVWRYARGMAFAAHGNIAAAKRERAAMRLANRLHVPALAGTYNSSDALLALADRVLAAQIARADGNLPLQIALLRAAVRMQDRLIYVEPPDWYFPVRETLGGVLLRSGRPAAAAAVFRADLARNPRNPRSSYGLGEALADLGQPDAARRARRVFAQGWWRADGPLDPATL